MGKSDKVIIGIVIISFLINCIALPFMPTRIVTHWDHRGESDGYMQKALGLFMLSFIIAMMAAIFVIIPKVDQVKPYIRKFLHFYYTFTIWFMLMFLFINIQVVLWNTGIFELNPLVVMNTSLILLVVGLTGCIFASKKINIENGKFFQ